MTVAKPLAASLVAVMLAVPGAMAVTRPADETVATVAADELHVTPRPVNAAPRESAVTAVAWVVCPVTRLVIASVTVTRATGFGAGMVEPLLLHPTAAPIPVTSAPRDQAIKRRMGRLRIVIVAAEDEWRQRKGTDRCRGERHRRLSGGFLPLEWRRHAELESVQVLELKHPHAPRTVGRLIQ